MIIKAVLLGVLTVTSYRPVPEQTRPECRGRFRCETSIGDGVTMYGAAVSRDLLKEGRVHYGDAIYVEGYGERVVNDVMGPNARQAIDLMVFTREEEKRVGVRRLKVYAVVGPPQEMPGEAAGACD